MRFHIFFSMHHSFAPFHDKIQAILSISHYYPSSMQIYETINNNLFDMHV